MLYSARLFGESYKARDHFSDDIYCLNHGIYNSIPRKDKIGRRKVLLICSTLVCLSGIVYISATNYNIILLGSGFAGFFSVGLGQYTLPLELVSAEKRFIVGTLITAGWAIGAGWYLLSSFIFRNWRYAATMNLTLVLLCLPTYYFFIPESPRIVFQSSLLAPFLAGTDCSRLQGRFENSCKMALETG